ncbi:hypothetical protein GCM10027580_15810 [Corynebacterium faecale]
MANPALLLRKAGAVPWIAIGHHIIRLMVIPPPAGALGKTHTPVARGFPILWRIFLHRPEFTVDGTIRTGKGYLASDAGIRDREIIPR